MYVHTQHGIQKLIRSRCFSFSKSYFQVPREFSGVYVVMWAYCTTSLFHEPELEDFRGIPQVDSADSRESSRATVRSRPTHKIYAS